jgi:hypothetical protein
MLRAGLPANACRTVHGRAKLALAPALYFRKFRLVILLIVGLLFHCTNAPRNISFTGAASCHFGNHEKSVSQASVAENGTRRLRIFTVNAPRPRLLHRPINSLLPPFLPCAKLSGRFSRELFENAIELM